MGNNNMWAVGVEEIYMYTYRLLQIKPCNSKFQVFRKTQKCVEKFSISPNTFVCFMNVIASMVCIRTDNNIDFLLCVFHPEC